MEHDGIRGERIAPIFFGPFALGEPESQSLNPFQQGFPATSGPGSLFHSKGEKSHCLDRDSRHLLVFLQGDVRYLAA